MSFVSPVFLSVFLPIVILLCILVRKKNLIQNIILTISSLVFIAWGDILSLGLILIGVIINWFCALKAEKGKKGLFYVGLFLNIGLLAFFKYAGFFIETFNSIFGTTIRNPNIPLPLGISFFIFQLISYLVDVKMGKQKATKNIFPLLLYISFFPQLIAGPIVRWEDMKEQITKRYVTAEGIGDGFHRFIIGLSKKVLLADMLGKMVENIFLISNEELIFPLAWLGAIGYTLQIFFDFSGYSDMALGLGKIFGFTFPENFKKPLSQSTLGGFWRHWHMTLTDWFRSYVYIPLGGNREGVYKTYRNLAIVFLLTGLWHGAQWTFVLWGAWNGFFVMVERIFNKKGEGNLLWRIYMLLVVFLGFVLFRAPNVAFALSYIKNMFSFTNITFTGWHRFIEQCTPLNITIFIISANIAFMRIKRKAPTLDRFIWLKNMKYVGTGLLLILCCSALLASDFHPFIYFHF